MKGSGLTYKGLPVLVADDDFIEHLHENGYTETIDSAELLLEWNDWVKENVEREHESN